jgi:hypothetical protein
MMYRLLKTQKKTDLHPPLFRDFRVDGVSSFAWPAGDFTGGRGVGIMAPNVYFSNGWDDPDNDIRNANHNFVRKITANNPASPFFGQEFDLQISSRFHGHWSSDTIRCSEQSILSLSIKIYSAFQSSNCFIHIIVANSLFPFRICGRYLYRSIYV